MPHFHTDFESSFALSAWMGDFSLIEKSTGSCYILEQKKKIEDHGMEIHSKFFPDLTTRELYEILMNWRCFLWQH